MSGRTTAPHWVVLAIWAMLAWCMTTTIVDLVAGRWAHGVFSVVNALAQLYAITTYIGTRASIEDTLQGWSLSGDRARTDPATRIGNRPAR